MAQFQLTILIINEFIQNLHSLSLEDNNYSAKELLANRCFVNNSSTSFRYLYACSSIQLDFNLATTRFFSQL